MHRNLQGRGKQTRSTDFFRRKQYGKSNSLCSILLYHILVFLKDFFFLFFNYHLNAFTFFNHHIDQDINILPWKVSHLSLPTHCPRKPPIAPRQRRNYSDCHHLGLVLPRQELHLENSLVVLWLRAQVQSLGGELAPLTPCSDFILYLIIITIFASLTALLRSITDVQYTAHIKRVSLYVLTQLHAYERVTTTKIINIYISQEFSPAPC